VSGFDLSQPALFHDRVDLEYQLSLDEMLIRVWHADVFENIAAVFFIAFGFND
jgi:hypothetical protein